MPSNKNDYHKTAEDLNEHDAKLKIAIVGAAAVSFMWRRPGNLLGLFTAYFAGARQLTAANHQHALESNRDWRGNLPKDPHPGFLGESKGAKQATNYIESIFKLGSFFAEKTYKESGLQEQMEDASNKKSPKKK